MILRGKAIPKLCLSFIVTLYSSAFAEISPTTKPSKVSDDSAAGQLGVVQEAMKHLYSIPRKSSVSKKSPSAITGSAAKARRVEAVTSKPAADDFDDDALIEDVVGYPGPYYQTRRRLPSHTRSFSDYRYFGGRPGRHGYGQTDYFHDDYPGEIYRFGFNRGYDRGRFDEESNDRTEAVLQHYSGHLGRGLTLFNQGRYREASDAFRLASDTHQGDPAARLYTAHALFAVGRYRDAVGYIRRAFELQPRLVFLSFDMRTDYGRRDDFNEQIATLEDAAQRSPANYDRLLLLGYIRYYSGERDRAYEALVAAYKLNRRDPMVKQLMDNCRPADVLLEARKETRSK